MAVPCAYELLNIWGYMWWHWVSNFGAIGLLLEKLCSFFYMYVYVPVCRNLQNEYVGYKRVLRTDVIYPTCDIRVRDMAKQQLTELTLCSSEATR